MRLIIKSGRSRFKLPISSPGPFTMAAPEKGIEFSLDDFKAGLEYASHASDASSPHSYMGVVQVCKTGGNIAFAGSNGLRLAILEIPATCPDFPTILFPASAVSLLKIFQADSFTLKENLSTFYLQDRIACLSVRKMAKTWPNYKHMIPATFGTRVKVAAQDMKDSLRRLAPLVDDKCQVLLTITDQSCIISISNAVGIGDDEVPVIPVENDPLFGEFKFIANHVYLTDYFNEVSGEVLMSGTDAGKPIFLECGAKKLLCASIRP